MNILKSIAIDIDVRELEYNPKKISVGCDGLSCSFLDVLILKSQWESIEKMIIGFSDFIENYIGDVNVLEKKAFEAGQNLLLNLNSDPDFHKKANEYAVKK